MRPLTTVLLAVLGALLVVSWVLASGPPAPAPAEVATVGQVSPPPPELAVINDEVDRLTERLAVAGRMQAPVRDPFQFEAPASGDRVDASGSEPIPSEPFVLVPQVAWPRLVAILTSADAEKTPARAVLEDANAIVQIRSAGETLGEITVANVSADGVLLTHSSGASRRVTLD